MKAVPLVFPIMCESPCCTRCLHHTSFGRAVAKEGVVLSWKGDSVPNESAEVEYTYRVYRRTEGNQQAVLAEKLSRDNPTLSSPILRSNGRRFTTITPNR